MLRAFLGVIALVVMPLLTSSTATAAEDLNCDYHATQEEAQRYYERYDHLKIALDPDGNGIACENLPSMASIVPSSLADAYNGRLQGGDAGYQITVAPDIEVTLVGIAPQFYALDKVDCPDLLTRNPVEDLVGFDANVFVTSVSGSTITEATDAIEDGILWVWDGDGEPVNVNVWLVANGFALWLPETTPDDLQYDFSAGEAEARSQSKALWGNCQAERNPIVPRFAPQSLRDQIDLIASFSGTWGDWGTFDIPEDGYYTVIVRAPRANSYIEIAALRNMASGQEYPEFYWTLFGPDTYTTQVYFAEGTYYFDCRAAGTWSFRVETLPAE